MGNISNNDIAKAIFLSGREKKGRDLDTYSQNVVKFLARKRLISKAPDILQRLRKISNKESGIVEAKVSSASKLSTETKHHLSQFFHKRYRAKDVIFNEAVDEKLLGGLKIDVDDEVIDLTLKNKVNKLQEHLIRSV